MSACGVDALPAHGRYEIKAKSVSVHPPPQYPTFQYLTVLHLSVTVTFGKKLQTVTHSVIYSQLVFDTVICDNNDPQQAAPIVPKYLAKGD